MGAMQCTICFFWVYLHCSNLQSVKEFDEDYSCSKCNNTTENTRDTSQHTLPSKGSRFRFLSSASQNKKRKRGGEPVINNNSSTDNTKKSKKDKNVDNTASSPEEQVSSH